MSLVPKQIRETNPYEVSRTYKPSGTFSRDFDYKAVLTALHDGVRNAGIGAKLGDSVVSIGNVQMGISGSARYSAPEGLLSKAKLTVHVDPKDKETGDRLAKIIDSVMGKYASVLKQVTK